MGLGKTVQSIVFLLEVFVSGSIADGSGEDGPVHRIPPEVFVSGSIADGSGEDGPVHRIPPEVFVSGSIADGSGEDGPVHCIPPGSLCKSAETGSIAYGCLGQKLWQLNSKTCMFALLMTLTCIILSSILSCCLDNDAYSNPLECWYPRSIPGDSPTVHNH